MTPTWIIVLHYGRVDDTRNCLRSLQRQRDAHCQILVVDNGSADELETLSRDEFPGVEVVRPNRNLGWAGGNNVGIRLALERGADRLVLLNNDTLADEQLIARLDAAGAANPDCGILGPIVRDLDAPHDVQTDGFIFNDSKQPGFFSRRPVAVDQISSSPPRVLQTDVVMGCCLWARREVFERISFIDERFFLLHEESDFCLRAAEAGFKVGVTPESLLLHRRSASFADVQKRVGGRPQRYYDVRNLLLLLRKHAGRRPGRRGCARSWKEYFLHAYYYHSDAIERGDPQAARAIAEGVADGLTGRWGPYGQRRRPLATAINWCFDWLRRVRGWTAPSRQVPVLPPVEAPGP